MDGQVKEARGQQLRTLDLHPVDEDVGPRILDEIQKFGNDKEAGPWREHDITLNLQTRYDWCMVQWSGRYNMSVPKQTTALLMPFQCEFEVLMSYNFYTSFLREPHPPEMETF